MFRIIYGDYGFRRAVHRPYEWGDGTDVLLDEGWTHGTVIGVEADGLVVDFGCEGMRRQLVKYGQAFRCVGCDVQVMSDESQREMGPRFAVEVLLRRAPQGPWVWRPATLITAGNSLVESQVLALVEVETGGVWRREVVGFDQVRPTPLAAARLPRAIQQGEFTSRTHPLADLAGPLAAALAVQPMPRWYCMVPFTVEKDGLVILESSSWEEYYPETSAADVVQYGIKRFIEESGVLLVKNLCLPSAYDPGEGAVTDSEWTLQSVHPHVLMEMVTHLDTMERVQLRRVCRAFDTFYSGTLSEDIRMTYRWWKHDKGWPFCGAQPYMLAAPLLQCFTSRTRRITLTNGDQSALNTVLRVLGTCGQLGLSATDQRVSVLAGQCELDVSGWERADGCTAAMAGARCRLLLFKQCTIDQLPDLPFSGSLHAGEGLEELLRLVESQLPAFNVRRTAEWVAEAVSGDEPDYRDILQDLRNFTLSYPRKDNA